MFGTLTHDAVVAWRSLVRRPFYPLATILMLALAIGANAAAFGIFYGYDVKPLPYARSSRLVLVRQILPKLGLFYPMTSDDIYRRLQASLPSIENAGLYTFGGAIDARIDGKPRAAQVAQVTPSFLTTLGAHPVFGRLLDSASGRPGGPDEAMISWQFWQGAFGGKTDVLGQEIMVYGTNYQIVGVLPRDFGFNSPAELWISFVPPRSGQQAKSINEFMPVLLRRGVSLGAFNAQLHRFFLQRKQQASPAEAATMRAGGERLDAKPIRSLLQQQDEIGELPALLQGTALFLLLLAVVNAGNLALVRHQSRMQDYALRRVLGATRADLLRGFLLEQAPILLAIGVIGSLLGWLALRQLASDATTFDNPPFNIAVGWPVFGFVWALAVIAIVAVAAAPMGQTSARALRGRLGQGTKSTLAPGARRAQSAMGAIQVALAAALLIGSTMLGVSLYRVLTQKLGFAADHRIVASILLPRDRNNPPGLEAAVHAVSAQNFTVSAGGAALWAYPFTQNHFDIGVKPFGSTALSRIVRQVPVTAGYFRTLAIPIERGQGFGPEALTGKGGNEAIISPDLARRLFDSTDVVGRMVARVGLGDYRIIGVASKILWQPTTFEEVSGTMYVPAVTLPKVYKVFPFSGGTVIAHVRGSVPAAMQGTKRAIEAAVPGAVVTSVQPYSQIIFAYSAFRAIVAELVAGFAFLALVLAALGVYAVNAFIARARLPEYGVRAMLGAGPDRLLRLALGEAARLLGIGLAGGVIGGYLLVRAMSPLLFETKAIAPYVFAGALLLIAAIVLAAAWRPAARAANTPVKRLLDA